MLERSLQPTPQLVQAAIGTCCEWGLPRLALELAEKIESASTTGQRVDESSWIDILIASARNQYVRHHVSIQLISLLLA